MPSPLLADMIATPPDGLALRAAPPAAPPDRLRQRQHNGLAPLLGIMPTGDFSPLAPPPRVQLKVRAQALSDTPVPIFMLRGFAPPETSA